MVCVHSVHVGQRPELSAGTLLVSQLVSSQVF